MNDSKTFANKLKDFINKYVEVKYQTGEVKVGQLIEVGKDYLVISNTEKHIIRLSEIKEVIERTPPI